MNVEHWDLIKSAPLAEILNELTAEIPYEYPVDQESFIASITRPTAELAKEVLLVAVEASKPKGYVHAAVIVDEESPEQRGVIRFLAFPRERRGVGQVLLNHAHAYLSGLGVSTYQAFTGKFGYPCLWYGTLKSPWEHIYALLGSNGYRVDGDWGLVAAWSNYKVREPVLPNKELDVQLEDAPIYFSSTDFGDQPAVVVRVLRNGEQVGIGQTQPYNLPYWGKVPRDVCFTRALEVKECERGRGIGRYILERSLFEMQRSGYCHATLSVDPSNFQALMLYVSMGYRVVYQMCHMVK